MKTNATETAVRRASERGHAQLGWLDSRHTFSFGDYYDPAHMGFRSLRVINDDRVSPGRGFPTHPHRDMEIFSYVLEGALSHSDNIGNARVLRPGQVQLMSAGSGVTHSEFNPSDREEAHFLQVWIQPNRRGLTPSYTEWHPETRHEGEPKVLIISRDGREGSATVHADADIYRIRLDGGAKLTHELSEGRGAWLHVAKGRLTANGAHMASGDGLGIESQGEVVIEADGPVEALLFDLG